ncbi:NUDIX domain-containing protein [Streptomyces sp. NBC_00111]|uniref:NUDIX domain-containing protein n=1 Tax=Streptomyces sp. NBC_00111 TaxID=2975655 RepID=UPI00324BCE8E
MTLGGTPEVAALREAGEETGLSDFKIVRKLGVAEYDMSPYRFELQRRHVCHLELTEPTPEGGPAGRTTTASRSRLTSSASGSRSRPPTCCSPARAPCWDACTTEVRTDHGLTPAPGGSR